MNRPLKIFSLIIILFLIGFSSFRAQTVPDGIIFDKNSLKKMADSLKLNISFSDSLKSNKDTILIKKAKSGLDSLVLYSAKDTVLFNIKSRTMHLRGNAKLDYKVQKLESEVINLKFDESLLDATGAMDTTGKTYGYPKFVDGSENFVGEKIVYNFKSNQGTITKGETKMSEGFYFGDKIKRVSESELFVKDGCYTACDAPHPHYYFGSPEMKVIAQDRIMIDPLIFYVEDMPIFILPIGIFFPNKSGRQSGIMIPSFFFSANRGVTFENFGLYLALSDYYDTKFSANFYSKGGYTLKNNTQWKLLDEFNGDMEIQYGKTRFNPDNEYTQNWSMRLNHNHTLTPQSQFIANLSFMSQDFNRNTSPNLRDRIQQDMTSNASYSQSFDNGSNFSVSYNRSQNIITNTYSQSPQVSFSLPQWFIMKSFVSPNSWLKDVNVSYSGNASYNHSKDLLIQDFKLTDSTKRTDTSFIYNHKAKISHNPSISISPKFGYFTISPSIGFRANNYFRRMTREMDAKDSTVFDKEESGFFTEYGYNFGLNISTRLYGMLKPKLFGLNAIRHTFQPTVGFSYTPDQSNPTNGFYGLYKDLRTNKDVRYSRFAHDDGGVASSYLSKSITYSVSNSIGAKIAQGDTLLDKTIDLFSFSFNGGYNLAADSLKASDISLSFHTPSLGNINFNGGAAFTLYDEAQIRNNVTNELTPYYTRINQFLLSNNKGLARLTSFNLSFSTSFNSSGMTLGNENYYGDTTKNKAKDSVGLGDRFRRRMEKDDTRFDYFGDNSPGYSPVSFPWNLSVSLNYNYSRPTINTKTQSINFSAMLSFKLTETWSVDGSAQYDFDKHDFLAPSINIRKDLHCWDLVFTWYPIGTNAGYYLRFAIKTPQLKDFKLERRSNPYF